MSAPTQVREPRHHLGEVMRSARLPPSTPSGPSPLLIARIGDWFRRGRARRVRCRCRCNPSGCARKAAEASQAAATSASGYVTQGSRRSGRPNVVMSESVGYLRYPERADGTYLCPAVGRARIGDLVMVTPWGGSEYRAWYGRVEAVEKLDESMRAKYYSRKAFSVRLREPALRSRTFERSPSAWAAGESDAIKAMGVFDEQGFSQDLRQDEIELMSKDIAQTNAQVRDLVGLLPTDEDFRVYCAAFTIRMAHQISNRLAVLAMK